MNKIFENIFSSRLSPDVKFRVDEQSGVQTWTFPCGKSAVCSVDVVVKPSSTLSQSMQADVYLKRSRFAGQWLTKFAEIGLEMIACRLGMPRGKTSFTRRFATQDEVEPFLLGIGDIVLAARGLLNEFFSSTSKHTFYDPDENFKITFNEEEDAQQTKPHLLVELSTFPVLAILPGGLDVCAKVKNIFQIEDFI